MGPKVKKGHLKKESYKPLFTHKSIILSNIRIYTYIFSQNIIVFLRTYVLTYFCFSCNTKYSTKHMVMKDKYLFKF